jgi:signal transduction histidine kinase
LNELGIAVSSTLHLDDLLERALAAIVGRLPFDRALILLVDDRERVLTGGRSIGGSSEVAELIREIRLSLDDPDSTLAQLAAADGPLVFRDVDEDPHEPNRAFARALEVTSFLGTPLVTKGRTVGVLAVDNRLSGKAVERSMGPLLFTVGNLLAAAIENARLYAEIEEHNRELESRVARRTAQLADATEEAIAARAAAEAASAAKSGFLANVSHELRTPLTSVVGFTKLVRKRFDEVIAPALAAAASSGEPDPKLDRAARQIRENLDIMAIEGERLTAMINDVLDLQKIEAGRMEFRREPVPVVEVVDQAMAAVAALFETTALTLVRAVPDGIESVVVGDRFRLVQVVINLLSNAVKFTPSGSVTVAVRVDEAEVVVSVTDTGTGIPAEDHEKVFEAFAQSADTLSDAPRGTGLGLPICRQIVAEHGGRLWLESVLGRGSTFSFSLPLAGTSSAPPEADREESVASTR